MHGFNEDGHRFIKNAADDLMSKAHLARVPMKISRKEAIEKKIPPAQQYTEIAAPKTFSHYVMNLPATAVDFLPDFIGLHAGREALFQPRNSAKLPMVHCYCFGPKSDDEQEDLAEARKLIWETVSSKLGCTINQHDADTELYDVRDVAPNKRMFCATFRLPADVAFRAISP